MNILVTGASRGMGFAIAEELLKSGHNVMMVAKERDRLKQARRRLAELTATSPVAQSCDVANPAAREALLQACKDIAFEPAVLVLNAGIFIEGSVLGAEEGALERTMEVNFEACYHLVRLFQEALLKSQGSRIILMGSTAAYESYPLGPLYGASKWALRGLAINLRKELMKLNIGVTFIAPGGTWTDLWAGEVLPKDRLLVPSDIAKLVRCSLELSPQAVVEEIVVRPMLGDIHE